MASDQRSALNLGRVFKVMFSLPDEFLQSQRILQTHEVEDLGEIPPGTILWIRSLEVFLGRPPKIEFEETPGEQTFPDFHWIYVGSPKIHLTLLGVLSRLSRTEAMDCKFAPIAFLPNPKEYYDYLDSGQFLALYQWLRQQHG